MADIEPPSFSLGLDLDAESEPIIYHHHHHQQQQQQCHQYTLNPAPDPSFTLLDSDDEEYLGPQVMGSEEENDEKFGAVVMDSDPEPSTDPPRILKRLRRGPAVEEPRDKRRELEGICCDNGDDEIEEFSSQEYVRDPQPSIQFNSVCSTSKVPLHGCGVLSSQSSSKWKTVKKEPASNAPSSSTLEPGLSGWMFPKLTSSPLRRFQLIDSDSEELSINEHVRRKSEKLNSSSMEQKSTASGQIKSLVEKHQNRDLWKDFNPMKAFHVPTPVLDEFCDEYCKSLQDKNVAQKLGSGSHTCGSIGNHQDTNSAAGFEQCWNSVDAFPPAHHYFFHDDPRVQKLVRDRLPNFSPMSIGNSRGNQQPIEPAMDFMNRFNGQAFKVGGSQRNNSEKSSTRRRNKSRKSNAKTKEVSHTSQGWMNPKASATIPKDAGKRRVHASGQAAGHWYTSPEGRKVYVSRNGQEFSGQSAYRCYRKEKGGFRKSKRKTSAKSKKS